MDPAPREPRTDLERMAAEHGRWTRLPEPVNFWEPHTILGVARMGGFEDMPLPAFSHPDDAGMDICIAEDVTLFAGKRRLVRTGLRFRITPGFYVQVVPRSGLAVKHGLSIVNTPATIDAGYTGEVKIPLINEDDRDPIELRRGDRVAQLIVRQCVRVAVQQMSEEQLDLMWSARGAGGFGHTGGHATLTPGSPE